VDAFTAERRFLDASIAAAALDALQQLDDGPRRRLQAGYGLAAHAVDLLDALATLRERASLDAEESTAQVGAPGDVDGLAAVGTRAALAQLRKINVVVRQLGHAIAELSEPTDLLGLGTAYLLTTFARGLVDESVDLIEVPVDGSEFATISWPFDGLLRFAELDEDVSWPDPERDNDRQPLLVLYPRREAASVLLAPLLVHELGHPVWATNQLSTKLWSELEAARWTTTEFKAVVDRSQRPTDTIKLAMWRRLEELFADALAMTCLGPSYLFAFVGWVTGMSMNEDKRDHPATVTRLELLIRQMSMQGWTSSLAGIPATVSWLTEMSEVEPVAGFEGLALEAYRSAHEHVVSLSESIAGEYRYSPQRFVAERQSDVLADLLRHGILPAQLDHNGRHADPQAILLAGWLDSLRCDMPRAIPEALGPAQREHQAFLDKAIEMSFVLQQWRRP
jgi:hypothetical protein